MASKVKRIGGKRTVSGHSQPKHTWEITAAKRSRQETDTESDSDVESNMDSQFVEKKSRLTFVKHELHEQEASDSQNGEDIENNDYDDPEYLRDVRPAHFNDADTVDAIQFIQERPHMWNLSNEHYYDRELRNNTWKELAKKKGIANPLSVKKWFKNQRDQFTKYMKKGNQKSGSAHRAFGPKTQLLLKRLDFLSGSIQYKHDSNFVNDILVNGFDSKSFELPDDRSSTQLSLVSSQGIPPQPLTVFRNTVPKNPRSSPKISRLPTIQPADEDEQTTSLQWQEPQNASDTTANSSRQQTQDSVLEALHRNNLLIEKLMVFLEKESQRREEQSIKEQHGQESESLQMYSRETRHLLGTIGDVFENLSPSAQKEGRVKLLNWAIEYSNQTK